MNLKNFSFVVVTHVYATGPAFKLEGYLINRVGDLIFIGHPFSFTKDNRSFLKLYKRGKLIYENKFINWKGPELSFYLKDVFLTLWWVVRYANKTDYFIGVDNLNAFAGYILKLLGKVKKYIFYTIDYIPERFDNKLLNSLYHFLDRLAVKKSDKVWNLSSIMVKEREKRGINSQYREKQIVVPIGTDIFRMPLPFSKISRYKIVHLGHLLKKQGVELLVAAMEDVIKKVPAANLLIIGGGPLDAKLKKDVERLKLEKSIKFTGFIKEFSDVEIMLRDAAIAVAPYLDNKDTYTRYTDPGKPKDYLASGIPVVITKVPQVAYEIERNQCGFAIDCNKGKLVEALIKLLTDDKLLDLFRRNAFKMAKKYGWKKIFDKAFSQTL